MARTPEEIAAAKALIERLAEENERKLAEERKREAEKNE